MSWRSSCRLGCVDLYCISYTVHCGADSFLPRAQINASPSPFETDPTPRHSPLSRSFPLFPTFHPKTSSSSHESANSAPSNLPHSFTKGLDARGLPLVVDYDGEARDSKASGAGKKSSYGFIPGIGVGVGGETMASGGAEDDYDQERSQLA